MNGAVHDDNGKWLLLLLPLPPLLLPLLPPLPPPPLVLLPLVTQRGLWSPPIAHCSSLSLSLSLFFLFPSTFCPISPGVHLPARMKMGPA